MAVDALPGDPSDVEGFHLNWRFESERATGRPYRLGDPNLPGTWRWLSTHVLGPTGFHSPAWARKRSKLPTLRDLLKEGPAAVRRGLEAWRLTDPDLKLPAGLEESGGYLGDTTPLLDALDLLDVYRPLEEPSS
jgi:hypothetical protein